MREISKIKKEESTEEELALESLCHQSTLHLPSIMSVLIDRIHPPTDSSSPLPADVRLTPCKDL